MAKLNYQKGVAQFAGTVDDLRHIGENDYGRSGDWIDIAVFGGIITIPSLAQVEIDDQVIVRGVLRNRGRVLDMVYQDLIVCKSEQELSAWDDAVNMSYRGLFRASFDAYDKISTITSKSSARFSCFFQGWGAQFRVPIDEEQYLKLKTYAGQMCEWHFDLVRDFRITSGENRQTLDTWMVVNPRPVVKKRTPSAANSTPAN